MKRLFACAAWSIGLYFGISLLIDAPIILKVAKDAANRALQGDLGTGLSYEAILFAALFATEDQVEGMRAFTEKREPDFKGR